MPRWHKKPAGALGPYRACNASVKGGARQEVESPWRACTTAEGGVAERQRREDPSTHTSPQQRTGPVLSAVARRKDARESGPQQRGRPVSGPTPTSLVGPGLGYRHGAGGLWPRASET